MSFFIFPYPIIEVNSLTTMVRFWLNEDQRLHHTIVFISVQGTQAHRAALLGVFVSLYLECAFGNVEHYALNIDKTLWR